jgi:hypothetical protein
VAVVPDSLKEKSIPATTNMAIAAATAIMPQLLRSRATGIGGFMASHVAPSLRIGPPGLNSVAIAFLAFVADRPTRGEIASFLNLNRVLHREHMRPMAQRIHCRSSLLSIMARQRRGKEMRVGHSKIDVAATRTVSPSLRATIVLCRFLTPLRGRCERGTPGRYFSKEQQP